MTENEIIAGVVIAAVFMLGWLCWPKKKEEEAALDPVKPESAPAPKAEIKPAPVPSLEPVVATQITDAVTQTPVKEETPVVKKETTKKAPAKKTPAKKAPAKKTAAPKKSVKKGRK